ncbi:MAG: hypothetical protein A4E35_01082 [Methanoregula sp. PtaU1.Bin051]|nr:MAG: hypothetical protein A4E35_01082 [Methanoregula sp. PtaU1.Bin051]
MNLFRRMPVLITCVVLVAMLGSPVNAADQQIMRTILPVSTGPEESVTVTLTIPPSFFGGVIETLPEGFTFSGTSHAADAVKRDGQTVIFAMTGEREIKYTILMPSAGCGYINGRWEDVGAKTSGTIPATLLVTPGADTSSCTGAQKSPGFGIPIILLAVCTITYCFCNTGKHV